MRRQGGERLLGGHELVVAGPVVERRDERHGLARRPRQRHAESDGGCAAHVDDEQRVRRQPVVRAAAARRPPRAAPPRASRTSGSSTSLRSRSRGASSSVYFAYARPRIVRAEAASGAARRRAPGASSSRTSGAAPSTRRSTDGRPWPRRRTPVASTASGDERSAAAHVRRSLAKTGTQSASCETWLCGVMRAK